MRLSAVAWSLILQVAAGGQDHIFKLFRLHHSKLCQVLGFAINVKRKIENARKCKK